MEIHIDIDIQITNTIQYNTQAVDIQNATLAGGVIVGASADMMLQVLHRTSPLPLDTCQNLMFPTISIQSKPYGALFAGCVAGTVATLGYQVSKMPFLIEVWIPNCIMTTIMINLTTTTTTTLARVPETTLP